jgi:hypothetical protein
MHFCVYLDNGILCFRTSKIHTELLPPFLIYDAVNFLDTFDYLP